MTMHSDALLGLVPEKKVSIDETLWSSTQRLLARIMVSCGHMLREARLLASRCRHSAGCPAVVDATITCLMTCPDRELWLSAKVIENNCLEYIGQVGPFSRNHNYSPPTREYWDLLVGKLEALQGAGDLLGDLAKGLAGLHPTLKPPAPREQATRTLVREPEDLVDTETTYEDETAEGGT